LAFLAVFQLLWGKFYPETSLFLLFNNGMSAKRGGKKKTDENEEVKSTEKLDLPHKVPLLSTYVGQACVLQYLPMPWWRGEALWMWKDFWVLLALLLTVIGMGRVTNGLILSSEVRVVSAAPRGCCECLSIQTSLSALHLHVSEAFCLSSW